MNEIFWSSEKVAPFLEKYKAYVESLATNKVLDLMLDGSDGSFSFQMSDTIKVNLTLARDWELFSIGRSNLSAGSMCGGGSFSCVHKFELGDAFSQPLNFKFELPGGTPYPIVSDKWDMSRGTVR